MRSLTRSPAAMRRMTLMGKPSVTAAAASSPTLPGLPLPAGLPSSPVALQYSSAMALRVSYFVSQAFINSSINNTGSNIDLSKIANVVVRVLTGAESSASFREESIVDKRMPFAEQSFWNAIFKALLNMLETDLRNIERGVYKMPADLVPSLTSPQWNPLAVARMAFDFMEDQKAVSERRKRRGGLDVRESFSKPENAPDYFYRSFHYQTDGWLSRKSSRIYDYQVETLFFGVADVMRRTVSLPHIHAFVESSGRQPADIRHLDVATGTGRFLSEVKHNYPSLRSTALDLSQAYLDEAREATLKDHTATTAFVNANAEAMPFADETFDLVTNVYLLHELPPPARRNVIREMARVLRVGGRLVIVDSAQKGDMGPALDAALARFPVSYHEPYYMSYINEKFGPFFEANGLRVETMELGFVNKSWVLTKVAPAAAAASVPAEGMATEAQAEDHVDSAMSEGSKPDSQSPSEAQ